MNDILHARLTEHVDPDHVCTPHNGGCDLPHYLDNFTLPHYIAQWPEASPALEAVEEIRELRDLEDE